MADEYLISGNWRECPQVVAALRILVEGARRAAPGRPGRRSKAPPPGWTEAPGEP